MATRATFIADFTSFDRAVQQSEVKLRSFQSGAAQVEKALARVGDSFSGRSILQEATLAARALEQLGEEGGIAAGLTKLTATELQRVGNVAKEAAAKMAALGQEVPQNLRQIADAAQQADQKFRTLQADAVQAERALARVDDAFSGRGLVQEATLAARAIEKLGEEGGIAAGLTKLTATELQHVGAQAKEAAAKLTALGQDVPQNLRQIAEAASPIPEKLSLSAKAADLAKSSFGQMFGAFTAANLVQGAVTGIVNMGKAAFETAGRTADLSAKLGISTEAIQRMEFVAGQTGGSIEQFASAAFKLGTRLASGNDSVASAVRQLGLDFDKLRNAKPEQQFEMVATALGKMDDATQRNALGVAIFGKSFEQVAAGVAANYGELAKQASVSSDAQIQALDRAGDAWDRFKNRTSTNVRGVLGDLVLMGEEFTKAGLMEKLAFLASIPTATGLAGSSIFGRTRLPEDKASDIRLAPQLTLSEDFTKTLKEAELAVAALTKEQRAQIDAAMKLGVSTDLLADKYGLSEEALRLYSGEVKAGTKAQTDFAKTSDQLFGRDVIAKANEYVSAVGHVSNASRLSRDKQLEVNRVVTEAIDAYRRLGQTAPAAVRDLAAATERLSARSVIFSGGVLAAWKADAKDVAAAMEQMVLGLDKFERSSLTIVGNIGSGFESGVQSSLDQMTKALEEFDREHSTFGQNVTGGLKAAVGDLPGTVLAALQGGGSVSRSVGGLFGGQLASSLFGKGTQQVLSNVLGKTLGGAIGSVVPGVGTLLGSIAGDLIGKLGGAFKDLFGGPSQKELEGRQVVKQVEEQLRSILNEQQRLEAGGESWKMTVIAVRDAYLATGRSAADAERDVKRLWESSKDGAEGAQRAAEKINEALREQHLDTERLNAAIEKYGFTLAELGPTFRNQRLAEQARELVEDWRVLVNSGIDLTVVNTKMADAMNAYLQSALKVGAEVPFAMKPILEALASQGLLVDENGNKISDLAGAGVTFSETMTQGFDRVVLKLQELIDRLQAAGIAIDDLPNEKVVDVQLRMRQDEISEFIDAQRAKLPSWFDGLLDRQEERLLGDPTAVIPMAKGGAGLVTKPTLFLAGEAGPEEVAFSGAGRRFGGSAAPSVSLRVDQVVLGDVGNRDPATVARQVLEELVDGLRRNEGGALTQIADMVAAV